MQRKLSKEEELEVYKDVLRKKKQTDIAKKFGISQSTVSYIYKKITIRNDQELSVSGALEFIAEYNKQYDYLSLQQEELQKLFESTEDEKLKEKLLMDMVSVSQTILYNCTHQKFVQTLQHDVSGFLQYVMEKNDGQTPQIDEPKGDHYQ